MDRRNVQVLTASGIFQKNCIHTKNVFSLVDLDFEDETFKKIVKHTEACDACSSELKKFELKNYEATFFVPKPLIDTDTKAAFEREVSEVFKAFELNEKEEFKKKIKKKIKSMDSAGAEFIKNLSSKNMVRTYAFGAVLFVVLRHFFN